MATLQGVTSSGKEGQGQIPGENKLFNSEGDRRATEDRTERKKENREHSE